MQILKNATSKLKDLAGYGTQLAPDPTLTDYTAKVEGLESALATLRANFTKYAANVLAMSNSGVVLSNDVAQFYRKSEPRQKSVQTFTSANLQLDGTAYRVFKEQYNADIMKIFDEWDEQIKKLQHNLKQTENARVQVAQLEHKVKHLQDKRTQRTLSPGESETLEDSEQKLEKYRNALVSMRKALDKNVTSLMDGRFKTFDRVFVRLMECQVEYFRSAVTQSDAFNPNIENYRLRFPRGAEEKATDTKQKTAEKSADTLESNGATPKKPSPSPAPVEKKKTAPISNGGTLREGLSNQSNQNNPDDEVGDIFSVIPSELIETTEPEEQTAPKQPPRTTSNGAHDLKAEQPPKPKQSPPSSNRGSISPSPQPQQSQVQQAQPNLFEMFEEQQAVSSPQSQQQQQQQPQPSPQKPQQKSTANPLETFDNFFDTPPVATSPPPSSSNNHSDGGFGFPEAITVPSGHNRSTSNSPMPGSGGGGASAGNGGANGARAPSRSVSQSTPPPVVRQNSWGAFDPFAEAQNPAPLPSKSGGGDFPDIGFNGSASGGNGGGGTRSRSNTGGGASPNGSGGSGGGGGGGGGGGSGGVVHKFSEEARERLDNEIARAQEEKLAEVREREEKVRSEREEKRVTTNLLDAKLKEWELKDGVQKNIRTLLSTLQTVLWADASWRTVGLADLIDMGGVKKQYRLALMVVHPDKVSTGTAEQKVIAERVFEALNTAFHKYQNENR